MLEHIPHWLGQALAGVRAGHDGLTIARLALPAVPGLSLNSPAFAPGGRLPERFTADGEGVSPPLVWTGVPEDAASLALIVEDPDAPTPRPLVHAILFDIDPALGNLAEGAIVADGAGRGGKNVGRNSGLSEGWLPPDPPTGHQSHDYVFQLFALSAGPASDESSPGRADFDEHVRGRVIAAGVLVGTYSRGEEAPVGLAGATPGFAV
jgi:Raf kinase inhibitor-like YbhB/YbcL family protein